MKRPAFMDALGIDIERADEHEAVLRMNVPDDLMTPFGTVHGGVIAALFDTALAIAISRRLDGPDRIATHNLNVSYLSFTREQVLLCHTRVLSLRRSVAVVEGEVLTQAGTMLAKALGTFGVRRQAA